MANTMSGKAGYRANPTDGETLITHALTSEGHDASEDGTGRGTPLVAAPLTKGSAAGEGVNAPGRRQEDDVNLVSFDAEYSNGASLGDDKAVLTRKLRRAVSSDATGVRRLTPTECERLQAWPDGWTNPNGNAPDSRRYAACGDGVTSSVAEWIGRRLLLSHVRGGA